jgi:hypothetical protein
MMPRCFGVSMMRSTWTPLAVGVSTKVCLNVPASCVLAENPKPLRGLELGDLHLVLELPAEGCPERAVSPAHGNGSVCERLNAERT